MAYRIQQRRDTAARWAEMNPILLDGEMGLVTDNPNQYKIGDGVHTWNELPLRGYTGTIAQTLGNNENAVASQKVVTEKFTEQDKKLSDIGSEVGVFQYLKGYITTGDIGTSVLTYTANGDDYWESVVLSVKEGDTYFITGQGGAGAKLWSFIDINNTVVSCSEAGYISQGEKITAPTNAIKLVCNFQHNIGKVLYKETRYDVQSSKKRINLLVFGNSYSYDSTGEGQGNLINLFNKMNIPIFLCIVGNGGASFESNYNMSINGEKNAYRWEGSEITGLTNKATEGFTYVDALKYKPWDFIVYHQASAYSGNIESFSYLQNLIDLAKIYCENENVKFGLMETWAYANINGAYPTGAVTVPQFNSQSEMYRAICETYKQAMKEYEDISFLVPSGIALQNARATSLGGKYNDFAASDTDFVHINDYGSLITSLVYFNKIYGAKNGISLSEISNNYSTIMSNEDFEIAKECAKKAIKEPWKVI